MRANLSDTSASFIMVSNRSADYVVSAIANFLVTTTTCTTDSSGKVTCFHSSIPSPVTVSKSVSARAFILSFQTRLVNVTDKETGYNLRNPDGTFYPADAICDSWNATFQFAGERTDISVNVTSAAPSSLQVQNFTSDSLGRAGRFCYAVRPDSPYGHFDAVLTGRALNLEGTSLALRESNQSFAVVRYDPQFTSYAYMMYRNSSAPSSLRRPWVLLVRYDGNSPGYSYAGDGNTHSFDGSRTLAERAFFSDFRYKTLSYRPAASSGILDFHKLNSTDILQHNWLNKNDSSPLYYGNRIEKYVFNVTASSIGPILSQGYIDQNITMVGCWQRENTCDLTQNYWLVPFLWSGRLNVVSVDSNGMVMPSTPITLTVHNPAPLDSWLTDNFERVFGEDPQALGAFEADLYTTSQTMTISGQGRLNIVLNQTSLVPPIISIAAGGASLSGNFTFTPVFVNSTITSVPDSLNGTIFYANATIPLWSYNMVRGSLAYLPIATTLDHPSTFLELLNSSGWVVGEHDGAPDPISVRLPAIRLLADGRESHGLREH